MGKKVGFGVVGIGNMGNSHVISMNILPHTELVAVCDRNPDAFNKIDEKVRAKIKCTTDYEEFLQTPGLEAVLVAVPHE